MKIFFKKSAFRLSNWEASVVAPEIQDQRILLISLNQNYKWMQQTLKNANNTPVILYILVKKQEGINYKLYNLKEAPLLDR